MEEKRDDDDRISALPECLLLEILSRLPDTKYAIKTGTLSKRWERLWTFVPTLIFTTDSLRNPNIESDFALLVSKTLTQCRHLKRKKFQVRTYYDIQYESHFNDWIRYAISCNVEQLILEFVGSQPKFVLDQDVFISSCFTNLRLDGCQLNPTGAISWENLRSLSIFKAIIDEELLVNLVSGSPLLETLELLFCRWPNITSDSESESESEANDIIGFNAPTSLSLTQCRQLKLFKNFQVFACYYIQFQSQLNNWIRYAIRCNVQQLDLGFFDEEYEDEFVLDQDVFINPCFTDLRLAGCKLNPTGAISWKNLRSLWFSRAIIDEELLVNIVSGSPLLEKLVLENCMWPNITSDDESEYESETDDINAPTSLSLAQCRQLEQLKLFKLDTSYDIKIQSQLKNWIQYAIRCNVEELDLSFRNKGCEDDFVLDQIVFTDSYFTELKLDGCMVNPVGAISWRNLRSLCISNFQSLDEDLIENILSGSPALETLVLVDCYGYRWLDITSRSVKNLELCVYEVPNGEAEADVIEINAPNILSLSIRVDPFLCKPLLLNVSSLVKAYLDYPCFTPEHCHKTPTEAEQEILKGCIMKLHHVKELELGISYSKVLDCLQAEGFVSPSNVKLNRGRW